MNLPIVIVKWTDAHDDSTDWTPLADIDQDPYIVTTVGFRLPKGAKKGHVSVARSMGDGVLDAIIHIPQKMVISIESLG